jgi:hypothetical protein
MQELQKNKEKKTAFCYKKEILVISYNYKNKNNKINLKIKTYSKI